MNYTEKTQTFEGYSPKKSIFTATTPFFIDKSMHIHDGLSRSAPSFVLPKEVRSCEALLGNREIRKPYEKIYQKYLRKQISQYALTVGNRSTKSSTKKLDKSKMKKIEFQDALSFKQSLKTINKSLCSCGRDTHFMNEHKIVDIKETKSSRSLKGLKSCGNNSACPVCAAKLSFVRGNQLKEMLAAGRENNRSYMMVVSTIPHKPGESLEITLNQVIDMSRYIFNSKEWKRFKKDTKCRFVHGGLENMVSVKNGLIDWHPHKNYLLDFDITTDQIIKDLELDNELDLRFYVSRMFTSIGQRWLDKQGIKKELLKPFLQQEQNSKRVHVKAGVSASLEFDDGYIAKWGLDAEMTAGIYKDGRFSESFHPFGLLDLIHDENTEVSKEDKYKYTMAFQEFVVYSKGKWWFYFARGAVAYYNEHYGTELKVKKDEEELQALEDNGDLIYSLALDEWLMFKPTSKKIGFALSRETRQEVIEYIFTEIELNRIIEYERKIE
jgi:hypothetical protein